MSGTACQSVQHVRKFEADHREPCCGRDWHSRCESRRQGSSMSMHREKRWETASGCGGQPWVGRGGVWKQSRSQSGTGWQAALTGTQFYAQFCTRQARGSDANRTVILSKIRTTCCRRISNHSLYFRELWQTWHTHASGGEQRMPMHVVLD
jgi:hypothetical protein